MSSRSGSSMQTDLNSKTKQNKQTNKTKKQSRFEAGERAQYKLGDLIALTEVLSSVPRTHVE